MCLLRGGVCVCARECSSVCVCVCFYACVHLTCRACARLPRLLMRPSAPSADFRGVQTEESVECLIDRRDGEVRASERLLKGLVVSIVVGATRRLR